MVFSWGYAFALHSLWQWILLTELLSRFRRRGHYSPRDSLTAESYAIPRTPTVLTSGIIYPTKLNHLRREPVRVTLECGWHPLVAQPYPCHLSLAFLALCSLLVNTLRNLIFHSDVFHLSENRAREKKLIIIARHYYSMEWGLFINRQRYSRNRLYCDQ